VKKAKKFAKPLEQKGMRPIPVIFKIVLAVILNGISRVMF
jgi:hypothetical protein